MNAWNILPGQPPRPSHTPLVYVKREVTWEYKAVVRTLDEETPLNEDELNKLGEDGWEMTGIVEHRPLVYFYFKRQTEK
ncbi:MAG: hypothetical protein AB1649_34755 [Chloroflexota bacterium]